MNDGFFVEVSKKIFDNFLKTNRYDQRTNIPRGGFEYTVKGPAFDKIRIAWEQYNKYYIRSDYVIKSEGPNVAR